MSGIALIFSDEYFLQAYWEILGDSILVAVVAVAVAVLTSSAHQAGTRFYVSAAPEPARELSARGVLSPP